MPNFADLKKKTEENINENTAEINKVALKIQAENENAKTKIERDEYKSALLLAQNNILESKKILEGSIKELDTIARDIRVTATDNCNMTQQQIEQLNDTLMALYNTNKAGMELLVDSNKVVEAVLNSGLQKFEDRVFLSLGRTTDKIIESAEKGSKNFEKASDSAIERVESNFTTLIKLQKQATALWLTASATHWIKSAAKWFLLITTWVMLATIIKSANGNDIVAAFKVMLGQQLLK